MEKKLSLPPEMRAITLSESAIAGAVLLIYLVRLERLERLQRLKKRRVLPAIVQVTRKLHSNGGSS
jgi:hypothetical protein